MKFVLTFAVSVLAAVALGAPAQASPCSEAVVEDWYDNSRVDRRYPIHCYREALRNLPEDMIAYSSAPEDIARAMRREIARQNQPGPTTTGNGDDGQAGGVGGNGTGGTTKPEAAIGTTEPMAEAAPPTSDASDDSPFGKAFEEIAPSNASSFPLPLAVLGGVALLLMAAGGMGLIARRMRPPRPPLQRR
ncbi:MAG: hypothetical protein WD027_08165 [Gaiellales bacterium]